MLFGEWTHGFHQTATVHDSRRVKKPHFRLHKNIDHLGTSVATQWLRLCTSTAGGTDSTPGQGTKISLAVLRGQKNRCRSLRHLSFKMEKICSFSSAQLLVHQVWIKDYIYIFHKIYLHVPIKCINVSFYKNLLSFYNTFIINYLKYQ